MGDQEWTEVNYKKKNKKEDQNFAYIASILQEVMKTKGKGKGNIKDIYYNTKPPPRPPWSSPRPPPKAKGYDVDVPHHQCGICHLLHSNPIADKCRRQCCQQDLVPLGHNGITGLKHIGTPPGTATPSKGGGKGAGKTSGKGERQISPPVSPLSAVTGNATTIATLDVVAIVKPNKDGTKAIKDLTLFGQTLKCIPMAQGTTTEAMDVDEGTVTAIASYKAIVATLSQDAASEHVKATIKEYENKIKALETPKHVEPPTITLVKMKGIEHQLIKHHHNASVALRTKLEEIEENIKLLAAQKLEVQQAVQEHEVQHQAKVKLMQDIYKHPDIQAMTTLTNDTTAAQNLATNVGRLGVLDTEMTTFLASTGVDIKDPAMVQAAMAVGHFCVGRMKTLVVEGSILEAAAAVSVPVLSSPQDTLAPDGGVAAIQRS